MRRKRPPPPLWQPTAQQWWGLTATLVLGSLPHLFRLPLPLILIWLGMIGWRLSRGLHGKGPPGALVKFAIILLSIALLLMAYGSVLGREAGTAMLVLMGALKMFELQQRRDAYVIIFLTLFLCAVNGLFQQSLLTMGYALLASWLIISVWQSISFPGPRSDWRQLLGGTSKLLLQALPLMLVLFILFPRIPGPLWRLPGDAHTGMTGLSEQMEPGAIGNLAQSEAVAFRVQFDGEIPPPELRYWRGPVFEMTDGRRWWPRDNFNYQPPRLIPQGPALAYRVTLEPHRQRWLLALDMPANITGKGRQQPGFDWQLNEPLTERIRYDASSWPAYRMEGLDFDTLAYTTFVPESVSQRVIALAQNWRAEANSSRQIVNRALAHFHQQPFVYTLTPPRLAANPVDEFLFDTRRGFCEHYASSFTMLMRAAGIPARVVTGYQGGELNQLDNYLIVRQSDAHAWAEVWLPNQGWVRIDPTAAVAPERIERPIDLGLQRRGEPVSFALDEGNALVRSWRQAQLAWDAVNHRWNQWVIGYDQQQQQQLLQRVGLPDVSWRGLVLTLTLLLAALLAALAWWLLRQRAASTDPAQQLYLRFCRKLARIGLVRAAQEGPFAYLARIEQQRPDLAQASRRITQLYTAHRYGRGRNQLQLAQLRRAVAQFKPRTA